MSKRRQLRPKEIVAGVGGEPSNLPLHSKYPAEKVWVLLGGECGLSDKSKYEIWALLYVRARHRGMGSQVPNVEI